MTSVELASKKAATPKGLPVRRWHSKQWQSETLMGSAVQLIWSWRQAQLATRFVIGPPP
jgi:hypothetical protein